MTGITFDARSEHASDGFELDRESQPRSVAPGKRTLTMDFPARTAPTQRDSRERGAGAALAPQRPAALMDDPFGLHVGEGASSARAGAKASATDLGPAQAELERAFGVSLAGVALHTGAEALEATGQRGVRAFALGDQVALPSTIPETERRFILAHEVAHVVQQRGGTGGVGDIEDAANAAAAAFVAGRPIPAQPAASHALAAYQGVVPPPPPVRISSPVVSPAPIGNQSAVPIESWAGLQYVRDRAARAETAGQQKVQLERAKPSLKRGGSAPLFISPVGMVLTVEWDEPKSGRRVRIEYTPRIFHILDAALRDIAAATTTAEFDSIWSVYLLDAPQPAPWQAQRELERLRSSDQPAERCTADGPNYWQPTSFTLPSSSPLALTTVHLYNLSRFADDPDGTTRAALMLPAIYAAARKTPATAAAIRPPGPPGTGHGIAEPAEPPGKRRPVPTLYLPLAKEPHLGVYQLLAGQGMLVHDPAEPRGNTKQDRKWDAALRLGGSHGITKATWEEAKQALDILGRHYPVPYRGAYRPDWTRTRVRTSMQVDHIIELQLIAPSARAAADDVVNYELLDEAANKSSGAALQAAIRRERQALFQQTGDAAFIDKPLTFERVVLGTGGPRGERWTVKEVSDGEHVSALRALVIPPSLGDR